jgi:hypothetical protein
MRTTERKAMQRYFLRTEKTIPIEKQIDAVLEEMTTVGVKSDEYPKLMSNLERLNDIKAKERREPLTYDTIALIAGNLMGILLIVAYEQKHVMTSKGFGQIIRPK